MATERDDETVGTASATVERGYEHRDIAVRTIAVVAGALVVVTTLAQVATYLQLGQLWRARQHELPPPVPVATALPAAPPEPRLQTSPAFDLKTVREAEDAQLHGYAWVDRKAGVVHIPIERAMELLAREAAR